MKKLVSVIGLVFMVSAVAATTGYDGAKDKPHIMDAPADQAPGNPSNISLPDLPGQASDTAKQVLDNIQKFFSGSIDNLGQTLQNLLGGQN